jgi:hypothetical protein
VFIHGRISHVRRRRIIAIALLLGGAVLSAFLMLRLRAVDFGAEATRSLLFESIVAGWLLNGATRERH